MLRQRYASPSATTYRSANGKYAVTVARDGAIRVRPGDWLSKYALAIYGNPWQIEAFRRKDRAGQYVPIRHPHWIYAGETIYHLPTVIEHGTIDEAAFTPTVIISDAAKKQLILETFEREHDFKNAWIEKVAHRLLYTHSALELAPLLQLLGELGAIAGEIGEGLNIFVFIVHSALDIIASWQTGIRINGYRGLTYGTTSWIWDDPPPPLPRWNYDPNAFSLPGAGIGRVRQAWLDGRDLGRHECDELEKKYRGEFTRPQLQEVLKQICENDPGECVRKGLHAIAKTEHLSDGEERVLWAPLPRYPDV